MAMEITDHQKFKAAAVLYKYNAMLEHGDAITEEEAVEALTAYCIACGVRTEEELLLIENEEVVASYEKAKELLRRAVSSAAAMG